MSQKQITKEQIQQASSNIRRRILGLALERGGCYLGQACSSAEILSTLYMKILNLGDSLGDMDAQPFPGVPSPTNMNYPKGSLYHGIQAPQYDRFFVSPAHYASVIYCALHECGRISSGAIEKFNIDGWNLEMIGAEHSPGFEMTAGSLGQAISVAAGTAHARKLKNEKGKVYTFLSDGELQPGQVWEALQAAAFYKLDNLIVYVDLNGTQVEGYTKDVMNIEPLHERFKSFGWEAVRIDGHDIEEIEASSRIRHSGKPLVVICETNPTQNIPMLKKKMPKVHFISFSEDELNIAKKTYNELSEPKRNKGE